MVLPLTRSIALDLNQLYFDHQISVMRRAATDNAGLRRVHGNNAAIVAHRIARIHRASGAAALYDWETSRLGLEAEAGNPRLIAS